MNKGTGGGSGGVAAGSLPLRLGGYLLTSALGADALGRVFRALRLSSEREFARLRVFESPEISENAVLDAIEQNGEIHAFLSNPAIARGVQMDAAQGTPFLAWSEPNGRTLDVLLSRARDRRQAIPFEHALLIGEKVATALEHAYNTMVDGERTLHGLVWPGFVSLSDDGETRLVGFGLASGFFPSMSRPRFAREIAPYLAPEERANLSVGKNSDVFSVGVLLFELLFGRLPSATDPLGEVKRMSETAPIAPEVMAVLRTCLSAADSRYQSAGELRLELGKILFSGGYAPSTFNLAFFLSGLFGEEIEAENRARALELSLDSATTRPLAPPGSPPRPAASPPGGRARSRLNLAIGGPLLLAAALGGTLYLITGRPPQAALDRVTPRPRRPASAPPPTALPSPVPTPAMSETQFKEEVSRRVAAELKKLEEQIRIRRAQARAEASMRPEGKPEATPRALPRAARRPTPEPAEAASPPANEPTAAPEPQPTPLAGDSEKGKR